MSSQLPRHPKLLLVDDAPQNIKLLEAVLAPRGYDLAVASSGEEALQKIASEAPDVVLLDIVMPGMDGYEVCRRLRADPVTALLPVVMITASGDQERVRAIEAGADDFLQKPLNQAEVLARIKSLVRVKSYHETIQKQTAELAEMNRTLESRVREQVAELERLGRMRRFLSPRLADLLVSAEGEALLETHRREIAVVCCHLCGFAELAETTAPEEVIGVLHDYHEAAGTVVSRGEGGVGPLNGDRLMVFFNDPLPTDDPAMDAVRMALALRGALEGLLTDWHRRGYELGFAAGVDLGYATLGPIGFEGRTEYGAVGPVVHRAERLRDAAQDGQILIGQRVQLAVERQVETTSVSELQLPGRGRPTAVYAVEAVRADLVPAEESLHVVAAAGPLTAREREVAVLIARGFTNRQIAETLVIAEATAVRHVANILNKLNLSSRARVAVWAFEQGLLADSTTST
jgi:DNA-binding NarL/FixJ family response regulator